MSGLVAAGGFGAAGALCQTGIRGGRRSGGAPCERCGGRHHEDIDRSAGAGRGVRRRHGRGAAGAGRGGRARQRDDAAAAAAAGGPERGGGVGGQGRIGLRAAGHHRRRAPLRAHDVQGHRGHRHPEHRAGPADHRPARRGEGGPAGRGGGPARCRAAGAHRGRGRSRPPDRPPPGADGPVRGPARPAGGAAHHGGLQPDLLGAGCLGDERGHQLRLHALLRERARQQARAVVLDGVGPAAQPRLPRVLRRARRRARGAAPAHRQHPHRQVRGAVRRPVLAVVAVRLAGGGLAERPRGHHPRRGAGVLRSVLRAQQPHGGAGRRLRPRRGEGAGRALLRPAGPGRPFAAAAAHPRDAPDEREADARLRRDEPAGRPPATTRCRTGTSTSRPSWCWASC